MKDLISIIVPVYNVENYLDRCIESIVNQTYKNLEIILIDDGSTDKSGQKCDEWAKKDSRIKVIHKENGGLSDARNVGIKSAKAELIGFVDSDDYINENMFEILNKDLKKYNADIAICNVQMIDEKKNYLQNNDGTENEIEILDKSTALQLLIENKIQSFAWNKLYKSKLFYNIKYPKGRKMEDLATTYKLFDISEKIVKDNKIAYNYVLRDNSISHSINYLLIIDWLKAVNERYDYLINKYINLTDVLITNKLFWISKFFNFYYELKNKDEKLEKVLNEEYVFYRKYYPKYRQEFKKNKKLLSLYLGKRVFKIYLYLFEVKMKIKKRKEIE